MHQFGFVCIVHAGADFPALRRSIAANTKLNI
jgi:hypothetical protein